MMEIMKSRLFSLWFLVLVFCFALAEVGRLAGNVQQSILDGLFPEASKWWAQPAGVHGLILVGLLIVFFMVSRKALSGVPFPTGKGARILVGVVVVLIVFLCLNQFTELKNVTSRKTDFGTIYLGSEAIFSGTDPYTATDKAYFYPPLLAFLFGPLLLLPLEGASTLFFSLKFIMVIWTLVACYNLAQGYRFRDTQRVLFITGLIFVGARFWVTDLQFGNTNTVILFLMTAAVFFDRQDRPLVAGLVLALATSIKILPAALCLHFMLTGRWRTLVSFSLSMAGLNLLPWLVLHNFWWENWAAYFDVGVTGKLSQRLAQPDNQSLWGMINRALPDASMATLRWIWMVLSGALVAFAGFVSFRSRNKASLTVVASASVYSLLGLLISPGSWVVHYTAVLLPMTVLLAVNMASHGPKPLGWLLFFITNFAFTLSGWSRPTVNASISQSWFVGGAVLLVLGLGSWVLSQKDLNAIFEKQHY